MFRSACLHSGFHRHTLLASPYRGFQLTFLCSLCFWLNFATSIFLSMKSSATTCSGKWLLTNSYPFRTYVCVHTSDSVSASCVKVFSRDVTVLGWYLCTKKKKMFLQCCLQATTILLVASVHCKLGVLPQATLTPLIPEQTLIASTSTDRTSLITRLPVGLGLVLGSQLLS